MDRNSRALHCYRAFAMPQLIFEGHSDDTFGEYGFTKDDHDCCASGALIVFSVTDESEGMNVVGQYGSTDWPDECPGCWLIGIQPIEEDVPITSWPMRFETADNGYSPRLIVDAPEGVKVRCLNKSR